MGHKKVIAMEEKKLSYKKIIKIFVYILIIYILGYLLFLLFGK